MEYQNINKSSTWNSPSQEKSSPLAPRPFAAPAKQPTQEDIENAAFEQNKFEAFRLQRKAELGKITPVEQERLGLLQATMDDFWAQKREQSKSRPNLLEILVRNPETTQPSEPAVPVQPKLTIGQPNDKYEQEADQVAAQVVKQINAPASTTSQDAGVQRQEMTEEEELQTKPEISTLQRMEMPEEEELQTKPDTVRVQRQELEDEELQTKPSAANLAMQPLQREAMEEDDELQMKPSTPSVGAEGGAVSADLEGKINAARGGGQSLAPQLQAQMGQAMGADFSGVRVHTDGRADVLNRSVGARAFTTGQDLFFKRGEYQPESRDGQELIAHELTHVMQQGASTIQRKIGEGASEGTLVKRTADNTFFSIVKASFQGKQWQYRIQRRGRGKKFFVKQNDPGYEKSTVDSYDYVFIGAGATAAYYIQENIEILKGKRILVIGPDQPWAEERGPGRINHPMAQIIPDRPPEEKAGLAERKDVGSFSEWVEKILSTHDLNIIRKKFRIKEHPALLDEHYQIEIDAENQPLIQTKNVILAIGIGPHAKPEGYDEIKEQNKGLPEPEAHQILSLPRIMSLDEFQRAIGEERLQNTFAQFEQHHKRKPVMILAGPNAGIDAVTTYARLLQGLCEFVWITGRDLSGIPFLQGTDNAKGKDVAEKKKDDAFKLDENRFKSVAIKGNKVIAAMEKGPSQEGELLVYALGPERDFLDKFLPEGKKAEELEPIYDRSNRISSAHDSSDESDLEEQIKAWVEKEYKDEKLNFNKEKLEELIEKYQTYIQRKDDFNAPDFGRKRSEVARAGRMEVSVVGLQVPQSQEEDAPSFKILGGSAYRLAEKVSYKHHSESIARIIDAATEAAKGQDPNNLLSTANEVRNKVEEVEIEGNRMLILISDRKTKKEEKERTNKELDTLLDKLYDVYIKLYSLLKNNSDNTTAKMLSSIPQYVVSLANSINHFDNRNNPLKANTHMTEIATTHPINVALGDQLTSVMSQVRVASEQEKPHQEERGQLGYQYVTSQEYVAAEESFKETRNLTIDDATTIAEFIATQYPDVPPVIANGITRQIIWDRRYGHPEDAVPKYDLETDKADTISQYNYQEKWKKQLSELNRLSLEMLQG
jgi:hypothetical protein